MPANRSATRHEKAGIRGAPPSVQPHDKRIEALSAEAAGELFGSLDIRRVANADAIQSFAGVEGLDRGAAITVLKLAAQRFRGGLTFESAHLHGVNRRRRRRRPFRRSFLDHLE